MRVALGGPSELTKPIAGDILKYMRNRKREQAFNISFCWTTLDIQDDELDQVDPNTTASSSDRTWNEENARERARFVSEIGTRFMLLDTPNTACDQLSILLNPVDLMILISEEDEDPTSSEWYDIAEQNGIEVTHQLIPDAPHEGEMYRMRDDDIAILRILHPDTDESEEAIYDQSRANLMKLGTDLLKKAVGDV